MKAFISNGMAKSVIKAFESQESTFPESVYQDLKNQLANDAAGDVSLYLPDDFLLQLHRSVLEREHLQTWEKQRVAAPENLKEQGWLRLTRLPISPVEQKEYALYPRWQNAIASLHTVRQRLCYVLYRTGAGETRLYLGAIPQELGVDSSAACNQLRQMVTAQMPGVELKSVQPMELMPLSFFPFCGSITGIPSVRKVTQYGEYQTLDQIAMGLRTQFAGGNVEESFALVIVADPVPDAEIVQTMRMMEDLGSDLHSLTQYSQSHSAGSSDSVTLSFTEGRNMSFNVGGRFGPEVGKINLGFTGGLNVGITNQKGSTVNSSEQVSLQYVNKSAIYCESLVDKHLSRLKGGRNMGFWKTGVYVMANSEQTVRTVMGMLRATYSGDNSYVEPIRTMVFPEPEKNAPRSYVERFNFAPCRNEGVASILGHLFEDYATPLTTEELSIATSLPRRDVYGIKLVRNATRFAVNPPRYPGSSQLPLGDVLDFGGGTGQKYCLDINQLVKHTLVAGANGSGKTTTCQTILDCVKEKDVPFLVIEPTKDEYLSWAIEKNRKENAGILVFAPGLNGSYRGEPIQSLRLNPFQPAGIPDAPLNMIGHIGRIKQALLGSVPMGDILPLLMEDGLYELVQAMDISSGKLPSDTTDSTYLNPLEHLFRDTPEMRYPRLEALEEIVQQRIEGRNYDRKVGDNLKACVATRVQGLVLGWKGKILNVDRSQDFSDLFEKHSVVINLSHLTDEDDKAFLMSILLIALWEFRESRYTYDDAYRAKADDNRLMHLTLIEEAHRLMNNTTKSTGNEVRSQSTTAQMFSMMLSELRAYGEGCVVVDQIPTRLISDAVKNTNLKIVHRLTSSDDVSAVSSGMRLRADQEQVIGVLQPGEAIVCSEYDDAAAWLKINRKAKK